MPAGAYAALLDFERTARMIPSAPDLADRLALAAAAAAQLALLPGAVADPAPVPADPAFGHLDAAVERTEPRDWWEALATVCLWPPLVGEVLAAGEDTGHEATRVDPIDTAWAEARLRARLEGDAVLAGRLLLWGRRLVGEAIALAREIVAAREARGAAEAQGAFAGPQDAEGTGNGPDFTVLAARLAEAHTGRLTALLPAAAEPEDPPREGRSRQRR